MNDEVANDHEEEAEGDDAEHPDITVELRYARMHPDTHSGVREVLLAQGFEIVEDDTCELGKVFFYSDPPLEDEDSTEDGDDELTQPAPLLN